MSLRPPAPTVQPGDRLDRYELLCPVSQGGMAVVWVGRLSGKHGFEKLFAIKMIRPEYASDREFQRMFLDEARLAARIQHPNVASIVELGDWHDILYIVMEWVDGDSVGKMLRIAGSAELAVPVGVACRIVADTLGGLHAAHELRDDQGNTMGVVHRDVSPQNVLVSVTGNTKLIDFGIAKAKNRLAPETSTGTVKGKYAYMSPEQAAGKRVDRTADVWAAGAVLYHLLGGHPPFVAENELAMLQALVSREPPPPLPSSVPASIQRIVARALHRDAAARYSTAEMMQRELEAAAVEAKMLTTPVDVASYVAKLTADRIAARKEAIDLALRSLSERRHVNEVLATAFPSAAGSRAYLLPPDATILNAPTVVNDPRALLDSTSVGTVAATQQGRPPRRPALAALATAGALVLALVGIYGARQLRSSPAAAPAVVASGAPPPVSSDLATALPPEPALLAPVSMSPAPAAPPAASSAGVHAPAPRAPRPAARAPQRNGNLGF